MIRRTKVAAMAIGLAVGLLATGETRAWEGGCGGYPECGGAYSWFGYSGVGNPYLLGNVPAPPYFAIHPPVYYGRRVGMPYGNSPLTRPPRPVVDIRLAPRESAAPPAGQWIDNPFVSPPQPRVASESGAETAIHATPIVLPETIENPHTAK